MKTAIKESKRLCWRDLITQVDTDPWGKPYQMVCKTFSRQTIPGLENPSWVLQIQKETFPTGPNLAPRPEAPCNISDDQLFTADELSKKGKTLKRKKSPGPDGIPNEAIKCIIKFYPELLLGMYSECLRKKHLFEDWKKQKVLRKGNKPLDCPSFCRLICLLDTLGKVLEGLILERIQSRLEREKLSDHQFGFRKGRSTLDAI